MPAAISALIIGPTGAGKSSLARKALKALGSGVVVMAPGFDEYNSYTEFHENSAYKFNGFDDPDFYPSLGEFKVGGMNALLRWQKEIFKEVQDHLKETGELKYRVFVQDTASNMGTLAHNAALTANNMQKPPAAQSPEGSAFYGSVKAYQEQMYHVPRALKGLKDAKGNGIHWITLSHQVERETTDVNNSLGQEGVKIKSIIPNVPGGFKDVLPGYFDLVLHAGVTRKNVDGKVSNRHWFQSMPSARRPTKSRLGTLNNGEKFDNDWELLQRLIESAVR